MLSSSLFEIRRMKSLSLPLLAALLAVFLTAALLGSSPLLAQEIYRIVDEHGNVTYTDQKPDDHAQPMELPELNVLDQGDGQSLIERAAREQAQATPAQSMNFRILHPADGARVGGQAELLRIFMDIGIEVPATAQIVPLLNHVELEPVHSLEADIPMPGPGRHLLSARLETPSGMVLGTTETIVFTVVDGAP